VKLKLTNSNLVALIDRDDWLRVKRYGWYLLSVGYVGTHMVVDGIKTIVYLHRFVMNAKRGDPGIDHKFGNKLDNRKSKLRFANQRTQQINSRRRRKYRGVYAGAGRAVGKWEASIGNYGRKIFLGLFTSKRKALAARYAAEIKYFGVRCP